MDVQLNFINNSRSENNDEVVIYQKNVAFSFDELAVAWKVIRYCGYGDNHPFTFSIGMQIDACDSWGNFTARLNASNGRFYEVALTSSGDTLRDYGPATSPGEIQCLNNLQRGAVNAHIYRSGLLLAKKTGIAPRGTAVFEFEPTIWLGVVSQVVQGEVMNSAIIANANTEISLIGIASADIVMTGGGPGPSSTPYQFNLENVVFA